MIVEDYAWCEHCGAFLDRGSVRRDDTDALCADCRGHHIRATLWWRREVEERQELIERDAVGGGRG